MPFYFGFNSFQVGLGLERSFKGEAANIVKSCGNSAVTLVALVARHFPGKLFLLFVLVMPLSLQMTSEKLIDQFNELHSKKLTYLQAVDIR